MMQLSKQQSNHIQILRGIAILAVVLIHNTPLGLAQVFVRPFINFCVALFLFLSGMLSSADRWNPKKRLLKILVPYVIWTFLYVLAKTYTAIGSFPLTFLHDLFHGKAVAIMYYVFVYCELTLLIPLIERLASSKYKYLGFLISPIEVLVMRTLPILLDFRLPSVLQVIVDISCLGWFGYFYLGYLIGNQKIEFKLRTATLWGAYALTTGLQILEGYLYLSRGYENCGTQLKLSALLSGVVTVLLAYRFIEAKKSYRLTVLRVLGDHSFGIYFSHLAIMGVLTFLPYYETYVIFPLNALVTVAISLAMCRIGKAILGKFSWILAL